MGLVLGKRCARETRRESRAARAQRLPHPGQYAIGENLVALACAGGLACAACARARAPRARRARAFACAERAPRVAGARTESIAPVCRLCIAVSRRFRATFAACRA